MPNAPRRSGLRAATAEPGSGLRAATAEPGRSGLRAATAEPGRSGLRAATAEGDRSGCPAATSITRREAIARITQLLGGTTVIGSHALLTACVDTPARTAAAAGGTREFSAAEIALLDEIAETILPATGTPGAKAAQTGAFMALMVTDAYDLRERRTFRAGLREIERACERMHGVPFLAATPAERLAVLEPLDREQKAEADEREAARRARALAAASANTAARATADATPRRSAPAARAEPPVHYFRMIKELALLGYFTSEIGYNQAMRYVESPGRFDPCVPYTEGETIWAAHA